MNLELLLTHADDHRPVLADGLPMDAAETAPRPATKTTLEDFRHDGGDPNSLPDQRWGLVVPEGPLGDRLLSLIEPLRKRREEQQGEPALVFRAPAQVDEESASAWWNEVYGDENIDEADRPRYLLMLGDADVLSWELQQRLAADTFIGRICFPDESGYEAYANKVVESERDRPTAGSRALYYTVRDGTAATNIGYNGLMTPTVEQSRLGQTKGVFGAREIIEIGNGENVSPDEFFDAMKSKDPAMLFTISHGCGAPRAGWSSPEEQRRLQGAMSFGNGIKITAEDLATRPFVPGGLWFYFACFGAGTPGNSAYHHWLAALRDIGLYGRNIDSVLHSLPTERPFVAALPQAALANPNGPLAVMGHVDLAWTFSFQEVGTSNKYRPSRFQDIFRTIVEGKRVGAGYFELQRYFNQASVDLTTMYDKDARAKARGGAAEDDKARKTRRATLWMLRQDLSAYILLGDPAARLPIEGPLAHEKPRATAAQIAALREELIVDLPTAVVAPAAPPPQSRDKRTYAAISSEALDALAGHFDVPRPELDQILSGLPGVDFVVHSTSVGVNLPTETAQPNQPVNFGAEDDGFPWLVYVKDSGRPEAGHPLDDGLIRAITTRRASMPVESELKPWRSGHAYFGHGDKAHHAYLKQYFERRLASATPQEARKINAFRAFQAREGSTASINTYDNQIVTWGTGWGGLGWMGRVVTSAVTTPAVRELFGQCGVRYRGKNTYDVVDLETRQVITGKKEALEIMRKSMPLLSMLIHASRDPETRDAVTEAQLGTFLISAGDIGAADAVATQALFNLIAHLRHWAPGYAMGCVEWALTQLPPGEPSVERDKTLAVLVGRYFYGKAHKFEWIPDWKQFQLYWRHMKDDGLDCLDTSFIQAKAAPTEDPFGGAPPPAPTQPNTAVATAPTTLRHPRLANAAELGPLTRGQGALRKGAHGAGVKAIQEAFISLGKEVPGGADGAFGPGLESVVKVFQAEKGLTADGIIGRGTLEALDKALSG